MKNRHDYDEQDLQDADDGRLLPNPISEDPDAEDEWDGPSKSQVKRELHEIFKLGKELVELPAAKLAQLPLSERMIEEIKTAHRITAHGGKKRQLQYVGKLLRQEDVEAVRRVMALWARGHQEDQAAFHAIEQLRDRLIADDGALTTLLQEHPELDIQQLRTLIRGARKEIKTEVLPGQTPPRKQYRALFQFLKQIH